MKPICRCRSLTWAAGTASRYRNGHVLCSIGSRCGQTTLFSGEGAVGKNLLMLNLCTAHALGRDWLGALPEPGPAIFVDAEDDKDEMRRRLKPILDCYRALR